ncbi:MAG TPA: hypothetical protein VEA38_12150 [Terriglobales bacterium]|nr:hypothetical protein [Terriglobales bacterium]
MSAVTFRFLPENGTLASGVREPGAATQNGLAAYINLDPNVSNDVEYEAAALPSASSPAWTNNGIGAPSESVSGGELSVSAETGEALYYSLARSGLASASPAYMRLRIKITESGTDRVYGFFARIDDGTKRWEVLGFVDRYVASILASSVAGVGASVTATTYHVIELCKINAAKLSVYADGRWAFDCPASYYPASAAADTFYFGPYLPTGTTTAVISSVHLKDATLWPSSSPTADFAFDSGVAGTVWDMSTIKMLENLFGEAGNLKYKYGAGETTSPTLNGSFLTAANLALESDPTGRYLRINVQLNGDGSQDAGWGGMEIAATTRRLVQPALGRGLAA